MAISNKLLVQFKYKLIDEQYDFYVLTTSDKYINSGAYTLDKPIESLKAESIVFDNGRSLFLMFKKGIINRFDLMNQIEDEKLSLKAVQASELKDYILFRLFLYSLNNFNSDEIKFNNITGKFYITNAKWIAKNKKTFKALNINVDQNLYIIEEASTFTQLALFTNKKALADYPRYEFSNKNGSLKRVLHSDNDNVYIRKSLFGKKAEIPFFEFSPKGLTNNKVYYLYKTLGLLQKKFNELLTFKFEKLNIVKTIGKSRNEKFDETVKDIIAFKDINIINWSNSEEYKDEFNELLAMFTLGRLGQVTSESKIKPGCYNLVYLHHKEYYEQNKFKDPYKNFAPDEIIQHVTIEDSVDKIIKNDKAIYNTILKEFLIKDDIVNGNKISLDNWASFDFSGDYVFGKEKDGVHYFIIVKPNGSFELIHKTNNLTVFDNSLLNKCSDYLTNNKGKEKTVIANPIGDVLVISRTAAFALPSKEIFEVEKIGRSKEEREQFLSGVVDINLYEDAEESFYSVGIKGSGMNTSISKASHLYQVDVIEGHNFIEELLETMAVSFVKYKSFTVMTYPIKYLNEYILMCENKKAQKA